MKAGPIFILITMHKFLEHTFMFVPEIGVVDLERDSGSGFSVDTVAGFLQKCDKCGASLL